MFDKKKLIAIEERAIEAVRVIAGGARSSPGLTVDEYTDAIAPKVRELVRGTLTEVVEMANREIEAAITGTADVIAEKLEKAGIIDARTAGHIRMAAEPPTPRPN